MPLALALLSSGLWGTADFLGGTLTRRRSPYVVVAWSQVAGLVVIAVLGVAAAGLGRTGSVLGTAVLASVFGYTGLIAFYAALAAGTMGVVAPITALGGIVPVVVGLAEGEQPSALQVVGVVVALTGVVLASGPEISGRAGARPILLAVVAAGCFGGALTFIALGSRTSALSTMFDMRVVTVVIGMLALLVLRRSPRVERREVAPLSVIGVFDVTANLTYGVAASVGLLSIVAVAGSLYPVATVLLARFVHHERLARVQQAGVVLALLGVALIATG